MNQLILTGRIASRLVEDTIARHANGKLDPRAPRSYTILIEPPGPVTGTLNLHFEASPDLVEFLDPAIPLAITITPLAKVATPETYFRVVEFAEPHASGADHAGIVQAPKVGGHWVFDLLKAKGDNAYELVKTGLIAPADARLTSFTELTATQAAADITAALLPGK